jgi:MoaA/NifB/PqqE/SkfB family radical SAM enzyme/SAM-dependent methyltransferase
MFKSSPSDRQELPEAAVLNIIDQAMDLGAAYFYFTGGEPFLSSALYPALEKVFDCRDRETHAVLLTNLTLIDRHIDRLCAFPSRRLHFQVSVDGIGKNHDRLRGRGTFEHLTGNLETLTGAGFPCTLAMAVTGGNIEDISDVIDLASRYGISNVHYLWLFKKGLAGNALFVPPVEIFPRLVAAREKAGKIGIKIDNVEIIRSQVFSCPGTKYDLGNAGWQSLAVGPGGDIYPTPALIFSPSMVCGHMDKGLEHVFHHSPVLKKIRSASLTDNAVYNRNPFKFLVGGGDIDHSIIDSGEILGGDPYLELYNSLAAWLIAKEAQFYTTIHGPAFKLRMGEILETCPMDSDGSGVFHTHSNCVLSLPGRDTHSLVNTFYSEAAEAPKEEIHNPVCYPYELIGHIPESPRFRSYGCGSPIVEAAVQPGETVVDLGCGAGIECFIAARLVGPGGKVFGIDMGDEMLSQANRSKQVVQERLNYGNIEFYKALLEDLPLADNSVDVVISNCVVNLSPNKRKVFNEISRVLKPGGRLVISDITYDGDIPLDIKYDEKLRGECIGGALDYPALFGLLDDVGFVQSKLLRGFNYRKVKGFDFYSITYRAYKTGEPGRNPVIPRPPFKQALAEVECAPACGCFTAPEETRPKAETVKTAAQPVHTAGCMVCGADLEYLDAEQDKQCFFCGRDKKANALCGGGHFVCDECHRAGAVEIIEQVCMNTAESDMVSLMMKIRSHPLFPVHGPEHHALVPGVILAAYRNSGGDIADDRLSSAIDRGAVVPGGSCAFLGACGAALGVGAAFSTILNATPLKGKERQTVQQITRQVLEKIASYDAPRCCQRDCWLALKEASHTAARLLPVEIKAEKELICGQYKQNKECIHASCPLWP